MLSNIHDRALLNVHKRKQILSQWGERTIETFYDEFQKFFGSDLTLRIVGVLLRNHACDDTDLVRWVLSFFQFIDQRVFFPPRDPFMGS